MNNNCRRLPFHIIFISDFWGFKGRVARRCAMFVLRALCVTQSADVIYLITSDIMSLYENLPFFDPKLLCFTGARHF